MNFIQQLLVFVVVVVVLVLGLDILVSYIERNECSDWSSVPGSYVDWQVDQCNHYNVELNR